MRRLIASSFLLLLCTSTAHALPSIQIIWQDTQTSTLAAEPSATAVADIVLRGEEPVLISGVFISIEFDVSELEAVTARELASVNLPGMGNSFSPVGVGVAIDNVAGVVTNFDQATLEGGLATTDSRTLGSIRFHVLNPTGGTGEADVIVSLKNVGIDAIVLDGDAIEAGPNRETLIAFDGADVILAVPESASGLLMLCGVAGLGYAGRRRS